MRGNISRTNYEGILNGTIRGTASGRDCNCLIYTLKQLISPSSNVDDVRKATQIGIDDTLFQLVSDEKVLGPWPEDSYTGNYSAFLLQRND